MVEADGVILLVMVNFLASGFIQITEIPLLLQR